tara:strand:- start:75 stop:293 length:219 start_codon:yes stop_codon:yes gene_type:complete
MTDWQDISTAPKDGTIVLLAGDGWIDAGAWVSELNDSDDPDGWTCWSVASWNYQEWSFARPTHWMPLPEPPQ